MDNIVFYIFAVVFLFFSLLKSKEKTKLGLLKAWKAFENILPQLLVVLLIVGLMLALMNAALISKFIGADSGIFGVVLAAAFGAITMIPPFVAFPTAAILLEAGAGYAQIAVFVSTLMMVGVITLPLEIKYFGVKVSIARNILAFLFSFIVAGFIGLVVY
ncbi:MAG: hypothetical protein FD141_509 [Fusobacteria bacterium]|nr:MAG: hypothetical protein FD141_509 [Fusobacteriota bacterium]KAF0228826.1 MAG: hypothetical protein FD182_1082 [Fusobacteriota bacterium]